MKTFPLEFFSMNLQRTSCWKDRVGHIELWLFKFMSNAMKKNFYVLSVESSSKSAFSISLFFDIVMLDNTYLSRTENGHLAPQLYCQHFCWLSLYNDSSMLSLPKSFLVVTFLPLTCETAWLTVISEFLTVEEASLWYLLYVQHRDLTANSNLEDILVLSCECWINFLK